MEGDLFGLNFSVFDIDLVTNQNNWNLLTDSSQIFVPFLDIGVGDTGTDIEHDDSTLSIDVVSVSESSELLLSSCVPNIEYYLSVSSMEWHGVNLYSECGNVSLLELSSQVTFDKSCLTDTSISYENQFEFWNLLLSLNHL